MSYEDDIVLVTKRFCEQRLLDASVGIATYFEAEDANDSPDDLYQYAQLRIDAPDDRVLGTNYYREQFQFQVFISAPSGDGTQNVLLRASEIRKLFYKTLSQKIGDSYIHVLTTPRIAGGGAIANGRTVSIVTINLVVESLTP